MQSQSEAKEHVKSQSETKDFVDSKISRNAGLESDICTAWAVAGCSFPRAKEGCEREFVRAFQGNTRSDACNSLPL